MSEQSDIPSVTITSIVTDEDLKVTLSFEHRPGYVLCEEKEGGDTIKYYYAPMVTAGEEEPEEQKGEDQKAKPGMRVVPNVGPYPRPILSPKEELFVAELFEIRVLLTRTIEQLRFVNFQVAGRRR